MTIFGFEILDLELEGKGTGLIDSDKSFRVVLDSRFLWFKTNFISSSE